MYLPKHFAQTDPAALQGLMLQHPLATIITTAEPGLTADLVPLEFHPELGTHGVLRGHVARANPLWRQQGTHVLAVFHGPQAYISPNWYPSKREHAKVVPTWNYTLVQARGTLVAVEDAPWVHALVSRLTDHHEAPQPAPWAVTDAPDDYVQQMLRAIVGIEIHVQSLLGKWKVSQNRLGADREGVADGLAQSGGQDNTSMADLVRNFGPG